MTPIYKIFYGLWCKPNEYYKYCFIILNILLYSNYSLKLFRTLLMRCQDEMGKRRTKKVKEYERIDTGTQYIFEQMCGLEYTDGLTSQRKRRDREIKNCDVKSRQQTNKILSLSWGWPEWPDILIGHIMPLISYEINIWPGDWWPIPRPM